MFLLLINCGLTTFGPLYIIYKGSTLSEGSGTLILSTMALFVYFLARFCQTLLVVSITPDFVESTWITNHFMKALPNFIDIFAVHYLIKTRTSTSFDLMTRLLAIGLGYAAADAFSNHLVWFFIEARKSEIGWNFIQRALTSNLTAVSYITLAVLVNLWIRPHNNNYKRFALTFYLLFQVVGIPFLTSVIGSTEIAEQYGWLGFSVQASLVILSSLAAKLLHDRHISEKFH